MQTVIGAFDDTATAQRAVEQLVQSGFDREDVHVQQSAGSSTTQATTTESSGSKSSSKGFFASLFGMDDAADHPHAQHASTYDEAVNRGSAVVVVDAQDEQQADRACELLHKLGAVDVDERSQQWRADGWQGYQPQQAGTQQFASTGQGVGDQTQRDLLARNGSMDKLPAGQEGVLDVVQEELQVGKRVMDRGGVRVIQRVSQKPVREVVRLREEHATVDRRPVNREATAADLSNFREGTLEVRESVEEPVVAKTARVVEEVRVGKEVREREETIEDTVRRKDVEVERLGGTVGERERAVAAADVTKGGSKDKPTL
jgi:uncharacterized protein (TIGR02271 family)